MTFIQLPEQSRVVPGSGSKASKIAIVGDYTTPFDEINLKPLSGPAGDLLGKCLHAAKLITGEVYITNTFKSKQKGKILDKRKGPSPDFFDEMKKGKGDPFTELGREHVEMLRTELNSLDANVIVAAGRPTFLALCGLGRLSEKRGYVFPSVGLDKVRKVIPTYSPVSIQRGMFVNRHLLVADLRKAKIQSEFPEIRRPERKLIYSFKSVDEVLQWLEYYEKQDIIATDIEVINYEIACISFASTTDVGCVIPLGASELQTRDWTEEEELLIWRGLQRVLGNPKITKVLQNAIFDIQFMLTKGIHLRGGVQDTMVGHSVMFPEFPKSLGFLGGLYCGAQAYWKDSVKFDNIKEES